jgi:hypothetical protein
MWGTGGSARFHQFWGGFRILGEGGWLGLPSWLPNDISPFFSMLFLPLDAALLFDVHAAIVGWLLFSFSALKAASAAQLYCKWLREIKLLNKTNRFIIILKSLKNKRTALDLGELYGKVCATRWKLPPYFSLPCATDRKKGEVLSLTEQELWQILKK